MHSESDGGRVACVCPEMHVRVGARGGMVAVVVATGLVSTDNMILFLHVKTRKKW